MSTKNKGLDMAVPYYLCPVTNEHVDAGLYIRSNKNGTMPLVSEDKMTLRDQYHGKCVGYKLSQKAKDDIGEGFYLIEYDESKTTEEDFKNGNPYRTGNIVGLKKEAWDQMWVEPKPYPEYQWIFVPAPVVEKMLKAHEG